MRHLLPSLEAALNCRVEHQIFRGLGRQRLIGVTRLPRSKIPSLSLKRSVQLIVSGSLHTVHRGKGMEESGQTLSFSRYFQNKPSWCFDFCGGFPILSASQGSEMEAARIFESIQQICIRRREVLLGPCLLFPPYSLDTTTKSL